MDRDAQRAAIHGVTKSQTWLSNWNELNWTEHVNSFLLTSVKVISFLDLDGHFNHFNPISTSLHSHQPSLKYLKYS